MTFVAGVLSNKESAQLSGVIRDLSERLQLSFMTNLSGLCGSSVSMFDGFVDTFQDTLGVDLELSSAMYSESDGRFSEIPGSTGLTRLIEFNDMGSVDLSHASELSVTDDGLMMNKNLISNGTLNESADYATPAMVSNSSPAPITVSASTEYAAPFCPAWRAFDHNEEHTNDPDQCWIATSSASELSPEWIRIDLGENMAIVVNKYRFLARNASDPAYVASPMDFQLLGSNDGLTWKELDSRKDFPQLAPNHWSEYLTFDNSTAYRIYQLKITSSWGSGLTSLSQLKLVEAQYALPESVQVAVVHGVSTSDWKAISGVFTDTVIPDSSNIFYVFCFNSGSGFEAWTIWNGANWKEIVKYEDGSWTYLDDEGTWRVPDSNDGMAALTNALCFPENTMDSQLLADASGHFSDVFIPGTLSVGVALKAGINMEAPLLRNISITYDEAGKGMDLISQPFDVSGPITGLLGSILVRNFDSNSKVYFSVGNESSEWMEFPASIRRASVDGQLELRSARVSELDISPGTVRIRVNSANGSPSEIHGWAMNWNNLGY